jgi:hypothetical protein
MYKRILHFFGIAVIVAGCSASKSSLSLYRKYAPEDLSYDYRVFENVLKQSHPGLYWYTSRDSMENYFNRGADQLKDSLTEPQFRKVLSYVTSKIHCGHTSVRPSKHFIKQIDTSYKRIFPLSMKIWKDTAVVAANLNRKDSVLKRGTVVTAINNKPITQIVDSLFEFLPADGYNRTHKFQALSNRGAFGNYYNNIFGTSEKYSIGYLDSSGEEEQESIPVYNPFGDTLNSSNLREYFTFSRKEKKQQELQYIRRLQVDKKNNTAFMEVGSFSRGYKLKKFFRESFKKIRKKKVQNLVIDLRGNGGGNVMNAVLLSKFLANKPFKLADSLYAIRRRSAYGRYIQNHLLNHIFMDFVTKKKADGNYHFGYFERHYFKPKKKNHFDGPTYLLTGGNSFSATILFAESVIHEKNVIVVGEETGGGAYGNSAWLIPDVTLPKTKVRFRLPLFRLVIDKDIPKNGRGVQPEVPSLPTVEAIKNGMDYKMDKVLELIRDGKH